MRYSHLLLPCGKQAAHARRSFMFVMCCATPRRVIPLLGNPSKVKGVFDFDGTLPTPAATLGELIKSPLVPQDMRQAIAIFCQVSTDLDELRRFTLFNFLALMKVLKKHDKLSLVPIKTCLIAFIATRAYRAAPDALDAALNAALDAARHLPARLFTLSQRAPHSHASYASCRPSCTQNPFSVVTGCSARSAL